MGKNVYISGGSGFLGRQIAHFVSKKNNIFCPRSTECNLFEFESIKKYFRDKKMAGTPIDVIINSAAYYGGLNITMAEPATIFSKNVSMINNLFTAAAESEIKKIIVIGSACAYPENIKGQMSEKDFWSGPLHESVEGYGFTKKVQLIAQKAYNKQYGIEGNHLILTNLYGMHDVFHEYRGHAISVLIKRYVDASLEKRDEVVNWGDGSAIREFLFVEDAAKIISKFIDLPHSLEPVNIGTGIGTSIKTLTKLIAKYANYTGNVKWDITKPSGVKQKVLDTSILKSLMPDFTSTTLETGLRKTIDWYTVNKLEADKRL